MILIVNDKEYTFTATMKKIVTINKKYKISNLRDTFFKALNNVDFEFLAELLISLADEETYNSFNKDLNHVYDLMESYVKEKNSTYEELYKMVADEINDNSFFGKKMSEEEMKKEMKNPLANFDIDKTINATAEKILVETFKEEFQGYKG